MKKILILWLFPIMLISQTNKEVAKQKMIEAINLMDNGKAEESLVLLNECEKLDSENYVYAYEKAYAYTSKKEYEKAIKELLRAKKFKNYRYEVDLLLANCYDYLNKSELALEIYNKGIKENPNIPYFEFEKGNYFFMKKDFNKAIVCYQNAIKIDPKYPSPYYRLSIILMNSNDKLSGLVYGEIFVNLERKTNRTLEISKLLFDTYKENITFKKDGAKIDFCDIVISEKHLSKDKITMPFCHYFGLNFIMATLNQSEINLNSLNTIRKTFVELYMKQSYKDMPNVLVEYLDKVNKAGFLDIYNRYVFMEGASDEFEKWYNENKESYDKFKLWYTKKENVIDVNKNNLYLLD